MTAHAFALACECGATIGLSPGCTNITDDMELEVLKSWESLHSGIGHERVSCFEARRIRDSFNRKHQSHVWAKNNPERNREIQARYREKRRRANY